MGLKDLKSNLDLALGESPVGDFEDISPQNFDKGQDSTHQQDSLIKQYKYKYGNSTEEVGPPNLDINGLPTSFDKGQDSTIQQDSLLKQY